MIPSLPQLREAALRQPTPYREGCTRIVSPTQTYARVAASLGRFGITRVANVTGLDRIGIPVVMVCRPNSRSVSVSQGKGLSLEAARVSGIMEAIELGHAERILRPLRFASAIELGERARVVDLRTLAATRDRRVQVDHHMLWIEAVELLDGRSTWLPFEIVNLNASAPLSPGGEFFASTSNGLASGNHVLEAVLHGLCEVIERDATTLFYALPTAEQALRRVCNDSIDDPDCQELLARFEAAEIEVMIWDITSNVAVPAFMCLIVDASGDRSQLYCSSSGYGCHPRRGVALARAMTEAAQSRLTLISGARDDVFREEYVDVDPAEIDAYRRLTPGSGPQRQFGASPTIIAESLESDVIAVLDELVYAGITSVLAVDLGDPDFGLPVVRVVVPGLEGPHAGKEGPRTAAGYSAGPRAQEARR